MVSDWVIVCACACVLCLADRILSVITLDGRMLYFTNAAAITQLLEVLLI
jgi:hypothetical protein